MIDELLDKWFKRKKFKASVEKFFYRHSSMERVYAFELGLMIVSTFFIVKMNYYFLTWVFAVRLYLYAMTKYGERFYPPIRQRFYSLLRTTAYNGMEILFFSALFIRSYNDVEYFLFGISLVALILYAFYSFLDHNGNRKLLMRVRGDYLFVVFLGVLFHRIDYMMLFLIVLFAFAVYEFLYKSMEEIKASSDYLKSQELVDKKKIIIEKRYGLEKKEKPKKVAKKSKNGEKSKKSEKSSKNKGNLSKSKRNGVKNTDKALKNKRTKKK